MARSSSNRTGLIILVVIALLVGGYFLVRKHSLPIVGTPPTAPGTETKAPPSAPGVAVAAADHVDPANEGKMVQITGRVESHAPASDTQLGVTATDAVVLLRFVDMLQWQEQHTATGEVSYTQVWSPQVIDSRRFKQPDGHVNPGKLPMSIARFASNDVRLGAYKLEGGSLTNPRLASLGTVRPAPFAVSTKMLPSNLAASFKDFNGGLYSGDPDHRQVGDVRVIYRIVQATDLTVVGVQHGDRITTQRIALPTAAKP